MDGPQHAASIRQNRQLSYQTTRLQDSHRVALQTQEIGTSILESLRRQGEQLSQIQDSLGTANRHIEKSKRIVRRMLRR